MRCKLGSFAAAAVLCLALAAPAGAADLKADIEAFIHQIESGAHGLVKWQGAKRFDVRHEGEADIADIGDARITIQDPDAKPPARQVEILLDHVTVRREKAPDNGVRLSIQLPPKVALNQGGEQATLTFDNATAAALLDATSGRARETTAAFAGARLADKTGDWVNFGPFSFSSKLAPAAGSGWTAPVDLDLKKIEFFFAKAPLGGTIARIGYSARSGGPDLAALNRLRDRFEALRQQPDDTLPEERLRAMLALLPSIPSVFGQAKGELTVTGVTARGATGEPLVSLAKASAGGELTGLASDAAALRMNFQYDGLALAPALAAANKVPRHAILDFGLENVATGPLRTILEAAGKMTPDAKDADKQAATGQMIGAAALLDPLLRIYDLSVDTPDLGVEATAEARGSPLSPKGYVAHADVAVRGFDALESLLAATPATPYLPLLAVIGEHTGAAADAATSLKFHLASAPRKWLTLNGSDIAPWFAGDGQKPGEPHLLRLQQPPITGADVAAVQAALKAHNIAAPDSGAYDGATAAAVARFQKQNGLNIDGVVDPATRLKLGVKTPPSMPPGHK